MTTHARKINPAVALQVRRDLVAHLARIDAEYAAANPAAKVVLNVKSTIHSIKQRLNWRWKVPGGPEHSH